jgi:DnaK suppressor protein
MEESRARQLLAAERERITGEASALGFVVEDDLSTTDLADSASDLYQQEFDQSRLEDLRTQLEALERAEQRLASGEFGRSVESGEAIPDARLEIVPTAERTEAEQARYEGR